MTEPLLRVSGLVKQFKVLDQGRPRNLTAVDNVSFDVHPGETVALIGESGSGKSTVARCIACLVETTAGDVTFGGQCLTALPRRSRWTAYRRLQMVFQDPTSSLNPRMTAQATVEEPLRLHFGLSRGDRAGKAVELLGQVGLGPALAGRYPRQLSGGQCQRVAIARALAVEPELLLLDEPTASLDVSVRHQILQLLERLRDERQLAYLFISHDLEVVRQIADRVLVMYLGVIVEQGTAAEVFEQPTHPYTRALLSSATVAEYGRLKVRFRLGGELASHMADAPGCPLAPRCPLAEPSCRESPPPLIATSPTHLVSCPVTATCVDRKEPDCLAR